MTAAGNIVGEVGLIVKPVDPGFNAGVQRIIDKIERDAQFKVAADTREAQSALQGIDSQVSGINNNLVQSAINVAGITAAFYALKGAANQVIGRFSTLFDQLAQAKAGFASILKSENAGNTLLADIQEFARVSPFVTQELVNYSQQLLGVGLSAQRITPLLKDVGNIISSVGGDTQNMGRVLFTLTQIQSIGRLAGQDAMQLQSALIPITKYLSEYLNKTTAEVKKLQEQGKISADTVFAAISAQGKNVEGAMDKATRNIAGARAILSDTITLMLQRSPELQRIFDDIFKSIVTFSNYLSQDDVSTAIGNFLKSVGEIYDGLKPLVASIASIGSGVGLSSLRAFTSILEVLSVALSAIPQPVIKLLASFFVGLSSVKAPLVLAKYVMNIQYLAKGALEAGVQIGRSTIAMNEQTAAAQRAAGAVNTLADAEERRRRSVGSNSMYGIGLATAGAFVSDGNGGTRDALGSIAQYAGMGAMIGGPWGAAAGGAIGALSSIVSASRKAAEDVKKDALEAADAWARSIEKRIEAEYGSTVNDKSAAQFLKGATGIDFVLNNYQTRLAKLKKEREELASTMSDVNPTEQEKNSYKSLTDQIDHLSDSYDRVKMQQEALFKDSAFVDYLTRASSALALISASHPEITPASVLGAGSGQRQGLVISQRQRDLLSGQDIPKSTEELRWVNAELSKMGLTLDDLSSKTKEELEKIVSMYTRIPDKIRDTLEATNDWLTRLKEAKATAETMWQPQQDKIAAIVSFNNAVTASLDSQAKAASNLKDVNAQLSAESQLFALKEQVYAKAIAEFGDNAVGKAKAAELAERAYGIAIQFRQSAMEAAEATARFANNDTNSATIENLLKIGQLADSLDNRQVIIDIATKGIGKAISDIEAANQALIDVGQSNIPQSEKNDLLAQARGQIAAANKVLDDINSGKYDNQFALEAAAAIADRDKEKNDAEAKRLAEEAAREAAQWASTVESATESLSKSIESAANAIKSAADSWIGSIKERTQYEQAVSTGRLTRNANRQVADIAELTSGISNLQGRGVPQSVLDALGINNVSDTRQLRKLVNSSDADLAALVATVSALDTGATSLAISQEDKRTRDNITQGIIDAAKALDITLSKDQAAGISNQFNIVPGTNAEEIALQILNILTSGRISA